MKRLLTILLLVGNLIFPISVTAQDTPVWLDYEDGLVNNFMADGYVVVIKYVTDWCNACETQQNLINRMRTDNPDYEKLKYISVDWEEFEKRAIVRNYDVFGRSTILIVRNGGEVANIFADTNRNVLKEALDLGLAAVAEHEAKSTSVTN